MNKNNLLGKVLIILGMLFVTTSTFAIPKDPCAPKDVCCEEPSPGPFAFSYPKDVGLACPRDFYIHGDFLWMKPIEEGLDYAMEQNYGTDNTFPLEIGTIYGFSSGSREWDWRPGFRVGFGFYTNYDAWNVDFNWSYFRMKAGAECKEEGTGTLKGLFLPPQAATTSIPHASARWGGDCNCLDLMIGKPYYVSRYFVSNPMFGIKAAWIDQDFLVRYFINDIKRTVTHKNDFWGIGFRGFYEGDFLLGSGWSLFGKAAFALLFGKFDTSQQADTARVLVNYKTEDAFYTVKPNAEVGFGFSWSDFFHKNQYKIALKVGYEFHYWWNQNHLRKFFDTDPVANDIVSRGDLSFNGFSFGLHIDF